MHNLPIFIVSMSIVMLIIGNTAPDKPEKTRNYEAELKEYIKKHK
jgi:hypothetical protein